MKKIKQMIIESIKKNLLELRLGINNPEYSRRNSTYSPGFADNNYSSRLSNSAGSFLENEDLNEADADDINNMADKIKKQNKSSLDKISKIDSYEDKLSKVDTNLDEFSGVGALGGGPVTPLGTDAKGKRVTKKNLKKQALFNRKKSYPYEKKSKNK